MSAYIESRTLRTDLSRGCRLMLAGAFMLFSQAQAVEPPQATLGIDAVVVNGAAEPEDGVAGPSECEQRLRSTIKEVTKDAEVVQLAAMIEREIGIVPELRLEASLLDGGGSGAVVGKMSALSITWEPNREYVEARRRLLERRQELKAEVESERKKYDKSNEAYERTVENPFTRAFKGVVERKRDGIKREYDETRMALMKIEMALGADRIESRLKKKVLATEALGAFRRDALDSCQFSRELVVKLLRTVRAEYAFTAEGVQVCTRKIKDAAEKLLPQEGERVVAPAGSQSGQ
jgi:hypothetical protein